MRIVSGEFRGKSLAAPQGVNTRPTSDRARQAIFNILEHAPWSEGLRDIRVIDLFAGSGALGFEALSRGAKFCLFVETDEDARGAIRENVDAMGLFGRTRVHRRDATQLGVRPGADGPAFDLAFLDPPYGKGLAEPALAAALQGGWLRPGAIVVVEERSDSEVAPVEGYQVIDRRSWGDTQAIFLRASMP